MSATTQPHPIYSVTVSTPTQASAPPRLISLSSETQTELWLLSKRWQALALHLESLAVSAISKSLPTPTES